MHYASKLLEAEREDIRLEALGIHEVQRRGQQIVKLINCEVNFQTSRRTLLDEVDLFIDGPGAIQAKLERLAEVRAKVFAKQKNLIPVGLLQDVRLLKRGDEQIPQAHHLDAVAAGNEK